MKLRYSLLQRFIELPECDPKQAGNSPLRHLLDDLGLEVKSTDENSDGSPIFTIETLANRGDHLYALGIAREISARLLNRVTYPAMASSLPEKKCAVPIKRATEKCHRYGLLEMVVPHPMPLRSDVSSVLGADCGKHHAIVDLLNYIQAEMGQPMHAFDQEKVEGEIIIDLATQVEQIEALDGKSYKVPAGSILIRDKKKIIAVAGIIGCSNSMVTENTKKVLIEAALFDPVSVRIAARGMGISTDASYAFERGVDPEGIVPAFKRLVQLAAGSAGAVGGGDAAHVVGYSMSDGPAFERRKTAIRLSRLRKEFNLPRLDEVEITARLKNLGYGVEVAPVDKSDKEFHCSVPSWRIWDIANADDLVEDVVRSMSFDRVKLQLPDLDYEAPHENPLERFTKTARPILVGNGFSEVITKGFYSHADVTLLEKRKAGSEEKHMRIKNAIEAHNSHMKITNVIHLARLLESNRRAGVETCKVFEQGRLFTNEASPSEEGGSLKYDFEREVLTFAMYGRWYEREWRSPEAIEEKVPLFRGVIDGLARSFGRDLSVGKSDSPYLHPGVQGSIKFGRSVCGEFGMLHPELARALDLRGEMLYAQIEVNRVMSLGDRDERDPLYDFPAIRRDLTLKVGTKDLAGRIERYILESKAANLTDCVIIDDFRREGEDFRRVTFRVTFQEPARTLQHSEVDAAVAVVLENLASKHSVEMAG